MDIVYILGTGSVHRNIELFYSMRSVHKHISGTGKCFVVGPKPTFINDDCIHVQAYDIHGMNKERNIMEKMIVACNDPRISDPFFCLHDDHLLLKDFAADKFPYCHKEKDLLHCLRLKKADDRYRVSMVNTYQELEKRKLPFLHYDIHVPFICDKNLFKFVMQQYDWTFSCGYLIKSLYCNTLLIDGQVMPDLKIRKAMNEAEIMATIDGHIRFSVDDPAINDYMINVFNSIYPEPAPWQLPGSEAIFR